MAAGRRTLLVCLMLACALVGGCSRNRNDLLENELRAKDTLYRESLHDLKRIEAQNEALLRELAAIRQSPGPPLPTEIAAPTFGLKRIALGRGTGGYDNDGMPGDESLMVVVEPRDIDDHVVKVPGSLHVTAIEIDRQGLKNPLCWWTLTPEQLRPLWKQGLLSTGYSVVLPWTVFPKCETVRIVAQFKLIDGRVFEADKDVKVRLLHTAPPAHGLPVPALEFPPLPTPTQPALPDPNPLPTPGIPHSTLRWSPAPLTDAATLGRPLPLPPATAPVVTPQWHFDE
jgi:hypothetical protein